MMYDIYKTLLENKQIIRKNIKNKLKNYIKKSKYFDGIFLLAYNKQLEQLILYELREEIKRLYPSLTYESLYDILDINLLNKLTNGYFFNINFFKKGVKT